MHRSVNWELARIPRSCSTKLFGPKIKQREMYEIESCMDRGKVECLVASMSDRWSTAEVAERNSVRALRLEDFSQSERGGFSGQLASTTIFWGLKLLATARLTIVTDIATGAAAQKQSSILSASFYETRKYFLFGNKCNNNMLFGNFLMIVSNNLLVPWRFATLKFEQIHI